MIIIIYKHWITVARAGCPGYESCLGERDLFPKYPNRLWDPLSFLPTGYRCSWPGVNRPGHDVDNSSPSSAEVKNEWSYTTTPPIWFHDVDKENINFVHST